MGFFKNVIAKALGLKPSGSTSLFQYMAYHQPGQLEKTKQLSMMYTSPAFFAATYRVADSFAMAPRWVEVDGERDDDHPLMALIDRPNDMMSGYFYRLIQQMYRDILGESLALPTLQRDFVAGENALSLIPILPTQAHLEYDKWRVHRQGEEQEFGLEELFWQRGIPNLLAPLGRGKGLGSVLADELQADEFAAQFESAFFLNGAKPEFVISLIGADDNRAKSFKKDWRRKFSGPQNAFLPVVFNNPHPEGKVAEIQELTQRFKDVETSKFRKMEHDIIRQTYGVPPEILGVIENSNRATIDASEIIMARRVTRPRLKLWMDDWNQHIVPLFDPSGRTKVVADAEEPEDKEHKRELMKNHYWAFTVNEIREEAGYAPLEGEDVFMRPAGAGGQGGAGDDEDGEGDSQAGGSAGALVPIPAGEPKQDAIKSIGEVDSIEEAEIIYLKADEVKCSSN